MIKFLRKVREKIVKSTVAVAGRQMKCGVYSCAAYEEFFADQSDLSRNPGDCSYCRLNDHNIISKVEKKIKDTHEFGQCPTVVISIKRLFIDNCILNAGR